MKLNYDLDNPYFLIREESHIITAPTKVLLFKKGLGFLSTVKLSSTTTLPKFNGHNLATTATKESANPVYCGIILDRELSNCTVLITYTALALTPINDASILLSLKTDLTPKLVNVPMSSIKNLPPTYPVVPHLVESKLLTNTAELEGVVHDITDTLKDKYLTSTKIDTYCLANPHLFRMAFSTQSIESQLADFKHEIQKLPTALDTFPGELNTLEYSENSFSGGGNRLKAATEKVDNIESDYLQTLLPVPLLGGQITKIDSLLMGAYFESGAGPQHRHGFSESVDVESHIANNLILKDSSGNPIPTDGYLTNILVDSTYFTKKKAPLTGKYTELLSKFEPKLHGTNKDIMVNVDSISAGVKKSILSIKTSGGTDLLTPSISSVVGELFAPIVKTQSGFSFITPNTFSGDLGDGIKTYTDRAFNLGTNIDVDHLHLTEYRDVDAVKAVSDYLPGKINGGDLTDEVLRLASEIINSNALATTPNPAVVRTKISKFLQTLANDETIGLLPKTYTADVLSNLVILDGFAISIDGTDTVILWSYADGHVLVKLDTYKSELAGTSAMYICPNASTSKEFTVTVKAPSSNLFPKINTLPEVSTPLHFKIVNNKLVRTTIKGITSFKNDSITAGVMLSTGIAIAEEQTITLYDVKGTFIKEFIITNLPIPSGTLAVGYKVIELLSGGNDDIVVVAELTKAGVRYITSVVLDNQLTNPSIGVLNLVKPSSTDRIGYLNNALIFTNATSITRVTSSKTTVNQITSGFTIKLLPATNDGIQYAELSNTANVNNSICRLIYT